MVKLKEETDAGNEEIKEMLRGRRLKAETALRPEDLLSTGSTLLNLALTGKARGGFAKGKYQWFVGDSSSGKSFFLMTVLAEAARNKHFENYDFYHDDNEDGVLMDIAAYFGKEVKRRMKAPPYGASKTSQTFYRNLNKCIEISKKTGRPFIYELDSENGLDSDEAKKKFKENKDKAEKGEKEKGQMTDGKAKYHSQNMRAIIPELKDTGSILVIVSQTRENIGFGFDPKTVSGGKALKFFATAEIWTSVVKTLTRTVQGKKLPIGIIVECRVKKNRFTGKARTIRIPIYYSHGFDDTGSVVDFLLEWNWWKEKNGKIRCTELRYKASDREDIIQHIEQEGKEKEMRMAATECWHWIEAQCVVERKPRYA